MVILTSEKGDGGESSSVDSDEFMDALCSDEEDKEIKRKNKRALEIVEEARNLKPLDLSDDYRTPDAHKDGGFPLDDAQVIAKYRNAFKDVVKQVGRTIFSGKFNLASVSFPIKCMSDKSMLYLIATLCMHAPHYMTRAALS